jgi:hypothetical protein
LLIFGCWARYKSCKCEVTEEFPLFGPQVLALMEFCHIRAYFFCKADMYKVCNCPARSPPFARPRGVGQAVGRAVALPPQPVLGGLSLQLSKRTSARFGQSALCTGHSLNRHAWQ